MTVKEQLKKNPLIVNMWRWGFGNACKLATVISPVLNTKLRYRNAFGRKLDLNNPKTLNEKVLWLKLNKYMKNPLVIQCADKARVRDYVEQCGCGDILIPLIGVYDKAEDIPWDELPDQFALKWNFGAGMNIICTDKSKLDREQTVRQLDEWGKCKYWLPHSEMQYKYITKKLCCERLLKDDNGSGVVPDYKVYCFHGEAKAILVMHDRGGTIKSEFFNTKWEPLRNTKKYISPKSQTDRPMCLEKMLDYANRLSVPFPFVRCDFYIVNNELYFGELTFTPAGGLGMSETEIDGKNMAEFL